MGPINLMITFLTLQVEHRANNFWLLVLVLWVAHTHLLKVLIPPFSVMSGPFGSQEAYSLHLLVPGVGAVGGTSPPIRNSLSGGTNKSPDTPYCSVSALQGPQEAHGLHLLVHGAVGGTSPPIKIS